MVELIAWRSGMADLNCNRANGNIEQTHFDDLHGPHSLDELLVTVRDLALSFGRDDPDSVLDVGGVLPRSLHDCTLASVDLDWARARLVLAFIGYRKILQLVADGVVDFHAPQQRPWGPSRHVIGYTGPIETEEAKKRLEIKMQTGDVITIVARWFWATEG